MSNEANQVPGGDPSEAGGNGNGGSGTVSHETYKRTVDSEKALKKALADSNARIAAFEQQQKSIEETKLLETNQHLTVIENLKKENESLKGNLESVHTERVETRKLNAAMGLLNQKGIQLDPQYLDLIPRDQIQVDADGNLDMGSVAKAVDNFVKSHPRLVTPLPNDLPGTRPGSGGSSLTLEQWSKLPYDEKLKRQKDVKLPNA